ncbi:MAG: PKD domain-containing protein [Ferruginibacter sp.]
MNTNTLTLLLFCLFASATGFTQDCPPNIDFENGDFSDWQCFTGTTSSQAGKNTITLASSLPLANRHTIISSTNTGLDPYGKFPMLCPYGGNYSVKLGNNGTGGQAEGVSYTFTVPVAIDTFTFTYFYAVVFEDPGHAIYEQPRFFVTAYDVTTGNVVNCASYDYVSNGSIPGFEVSDVNRLVLFKNWTPTSLQFAGLAGKTVRLEFKTADCTLGGHFGYAYLDVASGCTNILATAPYCIETNSLLLNAPYGFKTYTWYNADYSKIMGNQQSVTLSPPPVTAGVFNVDVIPYPGYGCRDTFYAVMKPLPVPDTPVALSQYVFCQYSPLTSLVATPSPGNDLIWYTSATGGTGQTTAPKPATSIVGNFDFYVSQKVMFGCESFRKKITVRILPTPIASFTTNTGRQCQNTNLFILTNSSTNTSDAVYSWNFGDGQLLSSATDTIVKYTYLKAGNFTINLNVVNGGMCPSNKQFTVTVIPKPIADFNYPAVICEKQTIVNVTDKSSVPTVTATINKWWWNFNGTILQTQNPASFVPNLPGVLTVAQVVTTAEGCSSDTNKVQMTVHHRPAASFKWSTPLCDNEVIRFTNQSSFPSASPDVINKWNWQFTNAGAATLSDPMVMFSPGIKHVRLVAETNFGCSSLLADSSFEIHPKPHVRLNISDSCVFRNIHFAATDLTISTDKWFWDFGDGLYNDNAQLTKNYRVKANQPVTLQAQTIFGCRDTLNRPFAIYDNIAFAGRDTVAAIDEPVFLNANGYAGTTYLWTPSIGLSSDTIVNPVATLDRLQLYKLATYTKEGCDAYTQILIKRYKGPELYIPGGFTPNGDLKNDVLRVFPVGIKSFNYFAVYDRLGNLVFHTTDYTKGWDGTLKGHPAGPGTFVAIALAVDYKGKVLRNKVSVVLIR